MVAVVVGGAVVGGAVVGGAVVAAVAGGTVVTGVGGMLWCEMSLGTTMPATTANASKPTTPRAKPVLPARCSTGGRYGAAPEGQGAPPGAW